MIEQNKSTHEESETATLKIPCKLTSKITGRTIEAHFTPRELLDLYEEQLVEKMSMCNCQPIGESYVYDCACYEEWEDYTLQVGDEI